MAKDATQDLWPRWPAGYEHPLSLVDIRVKLNVDKLFNLLYAPGSEYVVSELTRTVQYCHHSTAGMPQMQDCSALSWRDFFDADYLIQAFTR